jgi:hypothetical protein
MEEAKGGNIVVDLVVEEKVALNDLFLCYFVSMMIKLLAVRAASRDLIPGRRIDCRIFHTVRLGSGLHPISCRMSVGFPFC